MADYSIGDRVEVRWQAEPFAAKVVHVHIPGKVDVVYDIDGSVGIFLTVEEHGLKLLGDEEKKGRGGKRKVCVVGGCPNEARRKGQLCIKHGGKPCSVDGCSAKALSRGLCRKHDSKTVACSTEGCSNIAKGRGVCSKHGTKKICSFNNCTTAAVARGRCYKHGAYGTCKFEGCTSNAQGGSSHCKKHGGGYKPCSVAGCTTNSVRKGLCKKHGGGECGKKKIT